LTLYWEILAQKSDQKTNKKWTFELAYISVTSFCGNMVGFC